MHVEVFPLLREKQNVEHPEAAAVVARAHYHPFLSWRILAAHWHFLRRSPRVYWKTLFEVFRGTCGSLNFFVGALGIFPKSVRLALEMQSLGVQHLHAHFANHPAVAALIVHCLTGIPFSFTAHGSDLHKDKRMLARKVEAAAFAVTISTFNRDVMLRECGAGARDKIHVVHCGVDSDLFTPAPARESQTSTPSGFRILCVASLEEVKGHRYLLEACRLLRQEGLDFRCDLVGDGPQESNLKKQIAQFELGDRVHLLGLQPRPEVLRLLAAADVFCLPSVPTRAGKREGIPVVLMEAMACGLPVVSSRLSGIPELVEDGRTGLLVESGDSRAIADCLYRLAMEPERRRQLGLAGRQRVCAEFDLHVNAGRLGNLFAGSAERDHRSAPRGAAVKPGA
jgi:glycosyltransferase involved in cell wall biosynthesis